MTDGITEDKHDRFERVIRQLNKELHPLVVRAVLIDPIALKMPLNNAVKMRVLDDIIKYVHLITSLVIDNDRR